MQFVGGTLEVSGLRRVIFGKEGGRQSIYEWDGAHWLKVADIGDLEAFSVIGKALTECEMTQRIKGSTRNKRSRVWISGNTVNIVPVV